MLTTIEAVSVIPGMGNIAAVPTAWLNSLLVAADGAIKDYLKRDIELQSYVEFYSGSSLDLSRDIVTRQYPLLVGLTQIAPTSSGAVLPQPTINVVSTVGFCPGTFGNPNAVQPAIAVQVGLGQFQVVNYTGTTPTSFTGCTGGTGTLSSAPLLNQVNSPVVFFDQAGYFGQPPNSFLPNTLMVMGSQYIAITDSGGQVSNRGLIRRIGGAGAGFIGFYPENFYSGKLSAFRMPTWPRGDGNIKVAYSAGYPANKIPPAISYATAMLVAYMVRNQPSGAPLGSESLGAYSYNVLTQGTDIPEIGSIQRSLAPYRESSWGYP